jgi:hypothetical protein
MLVLQCVHTCNFSCRNPISRLILARPQVSELGLDVPYQYLSTLGLDIHNVKQVSTSYRPCTDLAHGCLQVRLLAGTAAC